MLVTSTKGIIIKLLQPCMIKNHNVLIDSKGF